MIRFADSGDYDAVLSLWKQCFPGDEEFTSWFFENKFRPENTLLDVEEDGALCAMTQMLPYRLRDSRGQRPVTYIYGACTAPDCRRQHRMERLLHYSFKWDVAHGRVGSVLIPAEAWLYDFYDQFGYSTAFYTASEQLEFDPHASASGSLRHLTPSDIPALNALYEQEGAQSSLLLLRSESDWRDLLALFAAQGAGSYGYFEEGVLRGYAFVWQDSEKLWAQEAIAAGDRAQRHLLQLISRTCGVRRIKITHPGMEERLGVIRYHDDTKLEAGYFNLLFN